MRQAEAHSPPRCLSWAHAIHSSTSPSLPSIQSCSTGMSRFSSSPSQSGRWDKRPPCLLLDVHDVAEERKRLWTIPTSWAKNRCINCTHVEAAVISVRCRLTIGSACTHAEDAGCMTLQKKTHLSTGFVLLLRIGVIYKGFLQHLQRRATRDEAHGQC